MLPQVRNVSCHVLDWIWVGRSSIGEIIPQPRGCFDRLHPYISEGSKGEPMKPWKIMVLMTLPMLLFAAWRIWSIYQERHEPVIVKQGPPEHKITQDDLVIPRKMYIDDLKSARELPGRRCGCRLGINWTITPIRAILLCSAIRK